MTRTDSSLRLAGALALTTATILVAAGCASAEPDAGEDLDFTFSFPSTENSPYEAIAQSYMDANPDITVTFNPVPAESYDTVLRTQLQAGNAADLIMAVPGSGSPIALLSLADADLLAPLYDSNNDLIPESSRALFYSGDELWGQPTDISVTGTVFNSSVGVDYPQDTTALMEACGSLEEGSSFFALAGSIPINAGLAAVSIAATNVYAEDPDWDSERARGEVAFASTPGWRDTLELIVDMDAAGCLQPGAAGAGVDALVQGLGGGTSLAAFIPGGVATEMAAGMGGKKLVVQSFPAAEGADSFIFASPDYALAISESSESKKGAQAFLDWFAEPENAAAYAKLAGSLPITGVEGLDLADTPYAPVAQLIADEQFVSFPVTVWTNQNVFLTLGTGVQGLLTGQQTVDGLLEALDAAWDGQ